MKRNCFLLVMLVSIVGSIWAQDAADTTNKVAFTVEVTYMTQGGVKKTDSISVFASDPRAAEREAEA
ncbi:MAG: hypothetical protein LBR47_03925 [Spirochaetaceae bacterium]|jgi:hypothetical protein|nr:hypothetical protein [Spirochaetaceae bacterium]